VVFEMSGASSAAEPSFDLLRIGGQLILVGSVFPIRPAQLVPEQIGCKLWRVYGLHNDTPMDLTAATELLDVASILHPFELLVDTRFQLDDMNDGLRNLMSSDTIRAAVHTRKQAVNLKEA